MLIRLNIILQINLNFRNNTLSVNNDMFLIKLKNREMKFDLKNNYLINPVKYVSFIKDSIRNMK